MSLDVPFAAPPGRRSIALPAGFTASSVASGRTRTPPAATTGRPPTEQVRTRLAAALALERRGVDARDRVVGLPVRKGVEHEQVNRQRRHGVLRKTSRPQ